jgi:polyisoprenoid-binding protein YceI
MNRCRLLLTAALALLTAAPAFAADPLWKIDPSHSSAEFGIKHFALSSVKGEIPVIGGTIEIPAGKTVPSAVTASLDLTKIDTKNDFRNNDIRGENWFDVAKYPTATFTSTKIVGTDPNNFTIDGNLTMHGVTKPIVMTAHFEGAGVGGRGEKRVAFSATATIHRQDWNLVDSHTNALGALVVGNDADVAIEVEGIGQ